MGRKPEPPLTTTMQAHIEGLIARAYREGWDVAETLNRAGLILTPKKEHALAAAGLKQLLENLLTWAPYEMLRRTNKRLENATPADMLEAVLGFIAEYTKRVEERGL